jgi:hypothetical protein
VLVTWIDHHKTSFEDSKQHGFSDLPGIRTEGTPSALMLAFEFYGGGLSSRQGIKLLSDYDTWQDWKTNWFTDILPFQFGMRHYNYLMGIYDLMKMPVETNEDVTLANETADRLAGNFLNNCGPYVHDVKSVGNILLKYQETNNRIAASRAFSFRWHDIRFACINQGGANSQLFDSVPFLYDAVMSFQFDGKINKWKFSLYGVMHTVGGHKGKSPTDLSVVAKSMGGGGHAGACGFEVNSLEQVFGVGCVEGPAIRVDDEAAWIDSKQP